LESRWDFKRSAAEKLTLLRVFIFQASSGTILVIRASSFNQTNHKVEHPNATKNNYAFKLQQKTENSDNLVLTLHFSQLSSSSHKFHKCNLDVHDFHLKQCVICIKFKMGLPKK